LRAAADITDTPPAGYEYTFADIDRALEYGFQVHDILTNKLQMETVVVQYSGQGCHVLGLDADPANRYDEASREAIVKMLTTRYEIPVDEKCTTDKSRFTRLPYSLHADVARVVTPIDSPDFDYRTDAQPDFLTEPTASVSEQ
jgi:DNA primase catalytic subunit